MPVSRKTPVLGIHKLGGASLFDATAVRHAATLIAAQKGGRLVITSAMAGVTDALLQGATRAALGDGDALCATATALRTRHLEAARVLVKDKVRRRALEAAIVELTDELELLARGLAVLRELTPRTSDYIVARGERLSARLLASTLAELGVKSEYVDATEVVRTDDTYGGAAPDSDGTEQAARDRLAARITRSVYVPVVPGFIGRSASGHVATLGRGGSDLTATLLARALKATSITLWKDVAGFLTADPRIVSDAQVIPQLTRGKRPSSRSTAPGGPHPPPALIPLGDRNIPIRIRPFASPKFRARKSPGAAPTRVPGQGDLQRVGAGLAHGDGERDAGCAGDRGAHLAALHRERVSVS